MNTIKQFIFYIKGLILILSVLFSTELLAQTPDFTGIKIVVNPGHGGHDSDDRGMPNGFWESEGNLTKGLWLRDILEARGCEVLMSRVENRTEDDLPLSQIAAIATDNNADLFLSIHSNAGSGKNFAMTIFNGHTETPTDPRAKEWAQIMWDKLIPNKTTFWTHIDNGHVIGDLTLHPTWTNGLGVLYNLNGEVPGVLS